MIARVDHPTRHRPIPDHLQIVVRDHVAPDARPADIAAELRAAFDPEQSRAIVFVDSRRKTEELADELDRLAGPEDPWARRTGAFHAGMSKEDRDEVFDRFRRGRLLVLAATKAFGLGMDIPNIHHVFHVRPPSSLEDYLQEIGRAGRDRHALREAGISPESPIRCVLYAVPDDFKRLKDRLHRDHLSRAELPRIQRALHAYAMRIGALPPAAELEAPSLFPSAQPPPFPLPLDLIEQADAFREVRNPDFVQRMGLHWLERLRRIRLAHYLPAHLEFENRDPGPCATAAEPVQALCAVIRKARAGSPDTAETQLVSTFRLFRALGMHDYPDLFRIIAEAQRSRLTRLYRPLKLRLTRKRELDVAVWAAGSSERLPVFLEAAYALAESVLRALPRDRTLELDLDWFAREGLVVAENHFGIVEDDVHAGGAEARRLVNVRKRETKDFLRPSRFQSVLRLAAACPSVLLRRELRDGAVVYLLRFDSDERPSLSPADYLHQHRVLAGRLLRIVLDKQRAELPIELVDLLLDADVPDHDFTLLEETLLFLRWMGYLRSFSLIPMAVQVHLLSTRPIDPADQADQPVLRDHEESRRLKLLRLAALQAVTGLRARDRMNAFIVSYFQCKDADDMMELIEATLLGIDDTHPVVRELREKALREREQSLSAEQRRVYDASFSTSVMVVAGPGSGKTHTLLLRLARLVHELNVDPASILVLAYNRAVVTEIRHRLSRLFGQLGYRSLIRSLRVFTFHGLIKYCIPDDVDDIDIDGDRTVDPWVERFLEIARQEPGRIAGRLDPQTTRYVFIDEFQDITEERYRMLRWLARPECSVTVIGDPNQSIYGYERAREPGASRASEPYFRRFAADYGAVEYRLLQNFRSYEPILRLAEGLIARNPARYLTDPLLAARAPEHGGPRGAGVDGAGWAETREEAGEAWFDVLRQVLEEENDRGLPYREVALLFRSNAEVYRAYLRVRRDLREWLETRHAVVRVQGDAVSPVRVREIAHYLDVLRHERAVRLREAGADPLPDGYLPAFAERIAGDEHPSGWDERALDVLRVALNEYPHEAAVEPTFTDVIGFLEDLLRRDNGQLYKLLQLDRDEAPRVQGAPDVVLSNIHKIKGLEFDAVVMPPSFTPLPFDRPGRVSPASGRVWGDVFDEERRVVYVGMTRARDRLVVFDGEREKSLRENRAFRLPASRQRQLGLAFDGNPYDGRLVLFQCARTRFVTGEGGFSSPEAYFDYLHEAVAPGDELALVRREDDWFVEHGGRVLAVLSRKGNAAVDRYLAALPRRLRPERMQGLLVTQVLRYTLEESLAYDRAHETTFSKAWSRFFVRKGFTYIVNFAGYATAG